MLPEGCFIADDFSAGPVDILIGSDLSDDYEGFSPDIRLIPGLRAKETILGWVLHGTGLKASIETTQHLSTVSMCRIAMVNHWELEGIGIQPEPEVPAITPSPRWSEKERRVEVPLLWKGEERPIPNFHTSYTRVNRMLASASEDRPKQYDTFMAS